MFKFLHAADIHLDSPLRGLERYAEAPVDEIRSAARRAFENLVELAIDEKVQFVVIAGDLYDGDWKDHNSGLYLVRQIARLRDAGIAVYIISGNHDAANKISYSLPLPTNPDGSAVMLSHTETQTVRLEEIGVMLHGRGFEESVIAENVVPQYPLAAPGWFNLGVLHSSLDYESGGEHARYAPCKISDLQSREYQYWALGHIHLRQERQRPGEPPIVYSGNLQGRHIRESGPKGCIVATVDDRQQTTLRFEPLDVFRWESLALDISNAETSDDVLAAARSAFAELVAQHDRPLGVRLTLHGECPAHEQIAGDLVAWTNQIRSIAIADAHDRLWVERVKLQTRSPRLREEGRHDGPLAELLSYIAELKLSESGLEKLGDEFAELQRQLPDEVAGGPEGLDLLRGNVIGDLLGEIEPLLVDRLTRKEAV